MASIQASGHREIARWKRDSDGAEIVLTGKPGASYRVLRKAFKGEGWSLSYRIPPKTKAPSAVSAVDGRATTLNMRRV